MIVMMMMMVMVYQCEEAELLRVCHEWLEMKLVPEVRLFPLYLEENDTDVAHRSFDGDQPVLITFGRDVAERVCYQTVICYPICPK